MSDRGDRIRELRRERGMTIAHLADLVGVSTRAVQGWEAGENLAYPNLIALAHALDTSVEHIEDGAPTGGPVPEGERLAALEARVQRQEAESRRRIRALEQEVAALREAVAALRVPV